jgi:hypothetical protein
MENFTVFSPHFSMVTGSGDSPAEGERAGFNVLKNIIK